MTKTEKAKLRKAIKLLHDSNEYWEGMSILMKLAGLELPVLPRLEVVSVVELFAEQCD
jgi:hypothetical protein